MKAIIKGSEPRSLTEHRAAEHTDYDNYGGKSALRAALVGEQRGLCCYCMGRVKNDVSSTKIEHWKCRNRYAALELDYRNLLAACKGGEGRPRKQQHCDTRKGNEDIQWNPAEPAHAIESRVQFDLDGTIRSPDPGFDTQLNSVLNLNLAWLKENRKKALDAFLMWYRSSRTKPSRKRLESEHARLTGMEGDGILEPYCAVPATWIKRKLEA